MFEKLISWEMALRRSIARTRAGKLIRAFLPHFRPSSFLLRTTGSEKCVEVNGRQMYVDLWDSAVAHHLFVSKTWEPEETKLVSSLLRPGDVFVDIGANLGYFTLLSSGLVGETGRVFAFEPAPRNFSLLQKNVEVNRCDNVVCEQKAIADREQMIELYLSSFNFGDHRTYESHDDSDYNRGRARKRVQVHGITLDSYFPSGTHIDFIKMDIQGAEYFALHGMKRVLGDNPAVMLMMEFWPHGLHEAGVEPAMLLSELDDLGLLTHRAEPGNVVLFPRAEILRIGGEDYVNLLLSRRTELLSPHLT